MICRFDICGFENPQFPNLPLPLETHLFPAECNQKYALVTSRGYSEGQGGSTWLPWPQNALEGLKVALLVSAKNQKWVFLALRIPSKRDQRATPGLFGGLEAPKTTVNLWGKFGIELKGHLWILTFRNGTRLPPAAAWRYRGPYTGMHLDCFKSQGSCPGGCTVHLPTIPTHRDSYKHSWRGQNGKYCRLHNTHVSSPFHSPLEPFQAMCRRCHVVRYPRMAPTSRRGHLHSLQHLLPRLRPPPPATAYQDTNTLKHKIIPGEI